MVRMGILAVIVEDDKVTWGVQGQTTKSEWMYILEMLYLKVQTVKRPSEDKFDLKNMPKFEPRKLT